MKFSLKTIERRFRAQADCEEYTAQNGRRCLRTVGTYAWYALMCARAEVFPKWIESGLDAEAQGDGFTLESFLQSTEQNGAGAERPPLPYL